MAIYVAKTFEDCNGAQNESYTTLIKELNSDLYSKASALLIRFVDFDN